MIIHKATRTWLPLALAALTAACADRPSSSGRISDGEAVSTSRVGLHSGSLRSGDRVLRLLYGAAAGADLRRGGLVVDLGSNNLYKYLDSADRATWGRLVKGGDGTSQVEVLNGARLSVQDRGGVSAVVLRARSETACTVTLLLDGQPAGDRRLGSDWTTLRYPLELATKPGKRTLELRLTYDGRPGTPAVARWLWLSTGGVLSSIERVGKRDFGEPMRSLLADSPRTYTFQVQVPVGCNLVFDYGARTLTRFEVNLGRGLAEPVSLFAARASQGTWYQAWIDLSEYAGKEVHLDLKTVAPPGRPGKSSGAAWGDPLLSCSSEPK